MLYKIIEAEGLEKFNKLLQKEIDDAWYVLNSHYVAIGPDGERNYSVMMSKTKEA